MEVTVTGEVGRLHDGVLEELVNTFVEINNNVKPASLKVVISGSKSNVFTFANVHYSQADSSEMSLKTFFDDGFVWREVPVKG